jgi:hypothetical protein
LFSSKVDPDEILAEYRTTRYPDRFYNLKIGIPWADLARRLDASTVLALCTDTPMLDHSDGWCTMGVDTGKQLHVVILREDPKEYYPQTIVYLGACHEFEELDALMKRFNVQRCVIDGLPETYATGQFAKRHYGKVYSSFFVDSQRGDPNWDTNRWAVTMNRTDALDASRAAIREKRVMLPRREPIVEEFAAHLSADAKMLDEDEQTGVKKYRYVKTGTNHFSMAFTYAWLGAVDRYSSLGLFIWLRREAERVTGIH